MKIKKHLCFAFLFTVLTAGYGQKKKVAVVTFYANKMVEFKELGIGSEELIKDVLDLRDNPDFNLTPLLEQYHSNFFNDYAQAFPFELLPEAVVVESEKYKNFEPKHDLNQYDARNYLNYGNYKYIYEGILGKYNEEGMAKLFADEADGVLFVNIDFAFEKGFGVGKTMSIKMRATTRIALYNKKGEKVFAFSESERSKKTGVMVGGIPVVKPDKILPMCESALTELMGDLKKRISKIISKTDKKL
ncbi:MAG: hypothetical protein RBR78_00060 [Flavobacteriaceae bacterium]|jgi:hypothetical protein|nr:hypothetical protein [Flavobacteriaceae bacterium]